LVRELCGVRNLLVGGGVGEAIVEVKLLGFELVDVVEEVGLVVERDDDEEVVLVVLDLELVVILDVGP